MVKVLSLVVLVGLVLAAIWAVAKSGVMSFSTRPDPELLDSVSRTVGSLKEAIAAIPTLPKIDLTSEVPGVSSSISDAVQSITDLGFNAIPQSCNLLTILTSLSPEDLLKVIRALPDPGRFLANQVGVTLPGWFPSLSTAPDLAEKFVRALDIPNKYLDAPDWLKNNLLSYAQKGVPSAISSIQLLATNGTPATINWMRTQLNNYAGWGDDLQFSRDILSNLADSGVGWAQDRVTELARVHNKLWARLKIVDFSKKGSTWAKTVITKSAAAGEQWAKTNIENFAKMGIGWAVTAANELAKGATMVGKEIVKGGKTVVCWLGFC